MAEVVSVSVPENLHKRWKQSNLQISPSALFQTALETELDQTNRHLVYWSQRALNAEKKLQMIQSLIDANTSEIKKLLLLQNER
jgi:post-segregation antitoxin (ccd killing protein)|tara:strand:+ start:311 stop:562 length:252 start_codon:yes stop_codon:yes gene_type:complete